MKTTIYFLMTFIAFHSWGESIEWETKETSFFFHPKEKDVANALLTHIYSSQWDCKEVGSSNNTNSTVKGTLTNDGMSLVYPMNLTLKRLERFIKESTHSSELEWTGIGVKNSTQYIAKESPNPWENDETIVTITFNLAKNRRRIENLTYLMEQKNTVYHNKGTFEKEKKVKEVKFMKSKEYECKNISSTESDASVDD